MRVLSQVMPPADLERLLTTPRYWMLQSLDPAGRGAALMAIMDLELEEKTRVLDKVGKSLATEHERFGGAGLVVIPDTNFLLQHPKSVDELPWASFATWDIAELVVAIPIRVIDELDKAKFRSESIQNGKQSLRTRARTTLRTLEGWFEHGDWHTLTPGRPSITATLLLDDPERQRLPDADYEIIGNAIALKGLTTGRVTIATFDSGMRLRARATGVTAVNPTVTDAASCDPRRGGDGVSRADRTHAARWGWRELRSSRFESLCQTSDVTAERSITHESPCVEPSPRDNQLGDGARRRGRVALGAQVAIVVALSGSVASGKTTLATRLADRWPGQIVSTRVEIQRLAEQRGEQLNTRRDFQDFGDRLDAETAGCWVADAAAQARVGEGGLLIVDAIRIQEQVIALRERFGRALVHVHLAATDRSELARRYRQRRTETGHMTELATYEELLANPTEAHIDRLADSADVVLDTFRNTENDLLVRCAARLGLLPSLTTPLVDVLVGGQYGSEGKGNIAYYLAPEYDVLVRVGGPNAGHKVRHDGHTLTHRSLPSGARANPDAPLIIGPGAAIAIDVFERELSETGVDPTRVHLDPQVMVITPEDRDDEQALREAIRSTAEGVGAAAARRILGRGEPTKLARDFPSLARYIAPTSELLNEAFAKERRVLIEGTQGTGLSLFHGTYPFVTSRDTTVAGTLAEVGIGPRRVRRAIMVARTYPIRVAGSSGPIGNGRELTWDEVEQRSGATAGTITELSSVTRQRRRVAEFDWTLLRRSAELNSATDVALTFADYISVKNRTAYRYEQLTAETLEFVEEVESVTGAAVSLIATDFSERSIIDRRTWRAVRR